MRSLSIELLLGLLLAAMVVAVAWSSVDPVPFVYQGF